MSKSNNFSFPDNVVFRDEAQEDFLQLDRSQQIITAKAIVKVSQNPAPVTEGGYGKPLSGKLAGYMKIKIKAAGIRVVYEYIQTENGMDIVIIGMREDEEVYREAEKRINRSGKP